jgi:hypothetical protein
VATDRLELGAVAGTFVIVSVAFSRQLARVSRAFIPVAFYGSLIVLLLFALAAVALFIPGLEKSHIYFVLGANLAICVFDCLTIKAVPNEKREAMEMMMVVDTPLFVSLVLACIYLRSHGSHFPESIADAVLCGMITMQFLISALLYAVIEVQIVSKWAEQAEVQQ